MGSTVMLIVVRGPLLGRKFIFEEPTACFIGRSRDCTIALSPEIENLDVSRHHCLVEINPPFLRVRDLGSLNGTFVNDVKIGQRQASLAPPDVDGTRQPAVALVDGDEVRLGEHLAFRVCILTRNQEESTHILQHASGELHFELSVPT